MVGDHGIEETLFRMAGLVAGCEANALCAEACAGPFSKSRSTGSALPCVMSTRARPQAVARKRDKSVGGDGSYSLAGSSDVRPIRIGSTICRLKNFRECPTCVRIADSIPEYHVSTKPFQLQPLRLRNACYIVARLTNPHFNGRSVWHDACWSYGRCVWHVRWLSAAFSRKRLRRHSLRQTKR